MQEASWVPVVFTIERHTVCRTASWVPMVFAIEGYTLLSFVS